MKLKKMLAGHLLVLVLVFPLSVIAADFNLNMKTALTNLHPDVVLVKVECFANDNSGTGPGGFKQNVGKGSTEVKVSKTGTISQSIPVKFNADPGINPGDATGFKCGLILISNKGSKGFPLAATNKLCSNADKEFLCATKGRPFNAIIEGNIP
jgi:hypothetical protein